MTQSLPLPCTCFEHSLNFYLLPLLNCVPAQSEEVRLDPDLLPDERDRGVVGANLEHGALRRTHEEPGA